VLRSGLVREPLSVGRDARQLGGPEALLVRGVLQLAAGDVVDALRSLEEASQLEEIDPVLGVAASMGAGVAALLGGEVRGEVMLEDAIDAAERLGAQWLARLGRVASRIGGAATDAARAADGFVPDSDPWGAALASLVEAWAPIVDSGSDRAGESGPEVRVAAAERAAAEFRRLGAGVLEALARGLSVYGQAEGGAPEARDSAVTVESLARATGTAAPRLLAYAAMARVDERRRAEYELLTSAVQRDTGLVLPGPIATQAPRTSHAATSPPPEAAADRVVLAPRRRGSEARPSPADAASLAIRAFGTFAVEMDGRALSLEAVKPRARALLRFLATRPGVAVHREVIQEALWPDIDTATGARSLHVAVSALRGLFVDALGAGGARVIAREGDAYVLAVDAGQVDVGRFEGAMMRARRHAGADATTEYATALATYVGDLLPQDGPAEWAVERRDHFRREAVEAATGVAESALASGDFEAAIRACQRGLELDRFHDPLWRVLIAAREQAGDAGAASRDRREYASVLEGLGVEHEMVVGSA
jgi:DNA-binding SARP family transcriptional activator